MVTSGVNEDLTEGRRVFFFISFFAGTEHPRKDNPDLHYWAEIIRQHTKTFDI